MTRVLLHTLHAPYQDVGRRLRGETHRLAEKYGAQLRDARATVTRQYGVPKLVLPHFCDLYFAGAARYFHVVHRMYVELIARPTWQGAGVGPAIVQDDGAAVAPEDQSFNLGETTCSVLLRRGPRRRFWLWGPGAPTHGAQDFAVHYLPVRRSQ